MSAYSAVARYLFSEASSGTTPTSVADSVGSNNLTINYQTNKAAWTSIAAGKGLDFTATGGSTNAALARVAATTSTIGSAFSGKTEASAIVAFRLDAVPAEGTLFNVVDDRGYDGSFSVRILEMSFGQLSIRVTFASDDATGGAQFYRFDWSPSSQLAYTTSALAVLHVVVDTTQAVSDNRVKLWFNGSQLTAADQFQGIAQNAAITTLTANDWLYAGNSPGNTNGMSIDGALFYLEVGTGQLTGGQVASTYSALVSNNDANAFAGGSSTTVTPTTAGVTMQGRGPNTGNSFTNVRIREVLVNASGQPVGSATDIGLRVWYSGICAGAPDISLNGQTTDANGTTSWSIATGSLVYQQPIFYVAQNSASYSHYTCGRLIPSYE